MKKHRFILLVVCFIFIQTIPISGHTYKIPIIIDTDMALDDARALVMLLNQDMCNILLTVTSDGAVSSKTGYQNLKKLFTHFNKEDIQVAIGRDLHKNPPLWRSWAEKIFSFDKPGVPLKKVNPRSAAEAIVNVLQAGENTSDLPLYLFSVSVPLTNLADALKIGYQHKRKKFTRVIYYGTTPLDPNPDWNTNREFTIGPKGFPFRAEDIYISSFKNQTHHIR